MEKLQGRCSSAPCEVDSFYSFLTMNYEQIYKKQRTKWENNNDFDAKS